MSTSSQPPLTLDRAVITLRIIVVGLGLGPLAFLGLVAFSFRPEPSEATLVTLIGAACAGMAIFARFAVGTWMDGVIRKHVATSLTDKSGHDTSPVPEPEQSELESRLLNALVARTIAPAAVIEGAAFANAVAYCLEGHSLSALVALGCVAALAISFPWRDQASAWLDSERRGIEELRALGTWRRQTE